MRIMLPKRSGRSAYGLVMAAICAGPLMGLSGCDNTTDAQLTGQARAAVAQSLKDPPSARFRTAFVVRQPPDKDGIVKWAVCGVVDGKNSFGAYTGGDRFVASGLYQGQQTFGGVYVQIDDHDTVRYDPEPDASWNHENGFDHFYWNPTCTGPGRAKVYTLAPDWAQ